MSVTVNASSVAECEDHAYKFIGELFYFIPLIYGIPTVLLYFNIISVIVVKRRNPVLKLAFFKLYAAYSVLMVVMWCFDMTSTRFIAIGYKCRDMLELFGTPSFELSPVQFVMTYSRHAQFYAATVLSINRMTAIWESHWVKFMAMMLILPLFTSWYLLPTQSYLRPYSLGGLTIAYNKIIPNALCSVTFTTLLVASFCAIIIFFSTIVTYIKLGSFRKNRGQWNKVDKNLLVVGMTSSVSTFLSAIAEIPLYMSINFGVMSQKHFFVAICIKQIVIDIRKAKGTDNATASPMRRRNSLKTLKICVKDKKQLERSRSLQDHGDAS
ncbi:integral membrane protein [Ancylostoma duodenale]|uniref:Serpentine receptor class gamma n=1 Tax=Ancylostoma duodenale TaxID=51022 RepID=A0A0C2GMH6_9BILA|nr:integral membrane protein [Ancylostoma duodenale]